MATAATSEPLLISVKRAAEILGISEWQVRKHFPLTKVGNRAYVPSKALREYDGDES